jgi:uroporphyrin-III C-methyltransferase
LEKGKIYLVGAGPGDPDLITVKGLRLVREADVVIYDRLVHPHILSQVRPGAELFYVGKASDHHTVPQDQINALMVSEARKGKGVVRLKGGDPFVFGRGAEELLYIVEQRIAWEVVPGVTSATAVPAYASIPITHRELSSMVSIIAGHENINKASSQVRFDLIAPGDSTLVILMGMSNLRGITEELIRHGRSGRTPACVITYGTYPEQRVVTGSLHDIAEKKDREGLKPPGIVLVGEVVSFRERLLRDRKIR